MEHWCVCQFFPHLYKSKSKCVLNLGVAYVRDEMGSKFA